MSDIPSFDQMPGDVSASAQPLQSSPAPMQQSPVKQLSFDDLPSDQEEKPASLGEQATALGHGLLKGVVSAPIATALERGYGRRGKDIIASEEAHPILTGVGEGAGLIGSSLAGIGEGALLNKLGEGVVAASTLAKPATLAARIGSSALQQAIEMGALQTGDEAAKFMNDPKQSVDSAIANIGMASALGGAGGAAFTGVIHPLWKATVAPKAEAVFSALASKLGDAKSAMNESFGLEVPNELNAVINNEPGARNMHSVLTQSDTTVAGRKYQNNLQDFQNQAADKVISVLGKDPSSIDSLPDLDKLSRGRQAGETLADELKEQIKPISDKYDKITEEFKNTPVSDDLRREISESIAQKSMEQGWHKAEDESVMNLVNKAQNKLPELMSVNDLKQAITNRRNANPFGSPTYQAAKEINKIYADAQERAITQGIQNKGLTPEVSMQKLSEYSALKGQYKNLMGTIDNLNEHLHVGRYDGPTSFLNALNDLSKTNGEGVLSRLSGTNKGSALETLQAFPKTLQHIKDYHIDKAISTAVDKAPPGTKINVNRLVKEIEKMSPQVKSAIAGPEQHAQIEGISKILDSLKDAGHNFSNTARTADKLAHGNISPLSMAAFLYSGGVDAMLTHLGGLGFREGRDALKYGMLKWLGSGQPVEAEGLKSMFSLTGHAMKGESALAKATSSVFDKSAQVVTKKVASNDRDTLDKHVEEFDKNPQKIAGQLMNSKTGHYMPEHGMQVTQSTSRNLQYLSTLKKETTPAPSGVLDKQMDPSPAQKARYNRALDIANDPLSVIDKVKTGTLQMSDIQDMNAMYPGYYQNMVQKLSNELSNAKENGTYVPYDTRMGLSLMLGQPVDNSMQPDSIQAAQSSFAPKQAPQPQQAPAKKGTKALEKTSNQYLTPGQTAEKDRSDRS